MADLALTVPGWTAQQIKAIAYQHFTPTWAVLTEVTVTDPDDPAGKTRRTDLLLVKRNAKAGGLETLAIEIKRARRDFLDDVKDPAKQRAWKAIADRHAYMAPAGLIIRSEVPAGSGLITVTRPATVCWASRAPYNCQPRGLTDQVLLALAHRLGAVEALTKGLRHDALSSDPEVLRALVKTQAVELEQSRTQTERATADVAAWRAYAAAAGGGVPCAHCGQLVTPTGSLKHSEFQRWRHVDPGHDPACKDIRAVAHEQGCREMWERTPQRHRHLYDDEDTYTADKPWLAMWAYVNVDIGPADAPAGEERA